ncbi:MAG TPA: exodeoxyribonuclease VII small subunit [Phycisphaerales bacterium]|nr:exodeoxyribonuclease VII small subunit [Phycisphaerales bacterium]
MDDMANLSFEDAIKELTGIVGAIEQGEVSLQDSLQQYEKGMALIQHCRGILRTAERRIEEISRVAEADEGQGVADGDEQDDEAEGQDEDDEIEEDEGQAGRPGRDDPTSPDGPGLYD